MERVQAFFRSVPVSWTLLLFGGLFTLSAITKGGYMVEALSTFMLGAALIYIEQVEEPQKGREMVWSKRILVALWVFIVASRYLSLLQGLNLWAH